MGCGFEDKIPLLLTGALSGAGQQAIEAHLSSCQDCRADLDFYRRLQAVGDADSPRISAAEWAGFDEGLAARLRQARSASRRLSGSRRPQRRGATGRLPWAWPAAVAAAAILAVVTAHYLQSAGTPPVIKKSAAPWTAEVGALSGHGAVVRAGSSLSAPAGTALLPGDLLRTGPDARLTVRYDDGTLVEMNARSDLKLDTEAAAKQLTLGKGDVFVVAVRQPEAWPLVMNPGRRDQVAVVGTSFELCRAPGTAVLRMASGRAQFGLGDAAVAVAGGQASRMPEQGSPEAPGPVELSAIAPWRRTTVEGLVGHWKFDEDSGDTALDSSGLGNNGRIIGAQRVSGRFGGALLLDEKDAVEIPFAPSLQATRAVTMTAWIRLLEQTNENIREQPYLAIGQAQEERNYRMSICRTGAGPHDWRLRASHSWEGSSPNIRARSAYTDVIAQRDGWMHVAFVITTERGGAYAAHLDGLRQKTFTDLTTRRGQRIPAGFNELLPVTAPLSIESVYEFRGMVDEVRIYNRALSEAEIAALAGKDGSPGR